MITTVFDCVSNSVDDNDSDMVTIGFITEYVKGKSQYRERVNLVMATSDDQTPEYFIPGERYIVSFTQQSAKAVGVFGDSGRHKSDAPEKKS